MFEWLSSHPLDSRMAFLDVIYRGEGSGPLCHNKVSPVTNSCFSPPHLFLFLGSASANAILTFTRLIRCIGLNQGFSLPRRIHPQGLVLLVSYRLLHRFTIHVGYLKSCAAT